MHGAHTLCCPLAAGMAKKYAEVHTGSHGVFKDSSEYGIIPAATCSSAGSACCTHLSPFAYVMRELPVILLSTKAPTYMSPLLRTGWKEEGWHAE